jgi:adenylate kinase
MGEAAKYVVLLGAPGAGKGTQADILQQRLGWVHISSGDLFRENVSKQTPLGQLAKSYMDKGELVPDEVTVQMVLERIARPDCVRGVVFDGFPRTEAQARALSTALQKVGKRVNGAVLVNVRDQVLVERLSARWVCPTDGAVYNMLSHPPRVNGRCDKDGSVLEQRNDDKPETVRRRLEVYHTQTQPLIDYYRAAGLLYEVNGEREIDQVQADLAQIVEKL